MQDSSKNYVTVSKSYDTVQVAQMNINKNLKKKAT